NPNSPPVSSWPPAGPAAHVRVPFNPGDDPQTVGLSFPGSGIAGAFSHPPASTGEGGPTQIVVTVNDRIKVFDKSGTLGSLSTSLDNFFNSVRGGAAVADPQIHFDAT